MSFTGITRSVSTAIGCTAVVAGVTSCALDDRSVPHQVPLPATWIMTDPDVPRGFQDPTDPTLSKFLLEKDGTAEVWNVPKGEVDDSDAPCITRSEGLYSGDATWQATGDGVLQLTFGETVMFWADRGFGGSLDWANLTLADCAESGRDTYGG